MNFPSFSIRRGLLEIRISCPFFCVHKNSADETQLNLTNTIYYRTIFLTLSQMSSLSFILKKASKRNLNKGKRKANQYQPQI